VFPKVEEAAIEGQVVVEESFNWLGEGGMLMLISLVVVLAGIYVAYRMYVRNRELPAKVVAKAPWAYRWSLNKFYMDEFYEVAVIRSTLSFSTMLWTFVDVRIIDGAVNGLAWLWDRLSVRLRPLQTGRVQDYALGVFSGMFVLVIVMHWVWRP